MMTTADQLLAALRARISSVGQSLESANDSDEELRARVRDEILAIGKEIERALGELPEVKTEVKGLAERYRKAFPRPAESSPKTITDHLGAATHRERGWSALASGDYERALEQLHRAVDLDSEEPGALVLLAWTYLRLEKLDRASAVVDRALALDPENPRGLVIRAVIDLERGRVAEAIDALTEVADRGTDRTAAMYAYLYLGVARARADMHPEAQRAFRTAVEMAPNLAEAYWELGRSYEAVGDIDRALETWRTGGRNRFNPWGQRCREAADRVGAERGGGSS